MLQNNKLVNLLPHLYILQLKLVNFICYEDSIICKKIEFHAFWQAHFNTNIVLRGTNSDCGGLIITAEVYLSQIHNFKAQGPLDQIQFCKARVRRFIHHRIWFLTMIELVRLPAMSDY